MSDGAPGLQLRRRSERRPAASGGEGGPGARGRDAHGRSPVSLALLAFMLVLLMRPQDQFAFVAPLHLAEMFGGVALVALVIGRISRGLPITSVTPRARGPLCIAMVMVGNRSVFVLAGRVDGAFVTNLFLKVLLVTMVIVEHRRRRAGGSRSSRQWCSAAPAMWMCGPSWTTFADVESGRRRTRQGCGRRPVRQSERHGADHGVVPAVRNRHGADGRPDGSFRLLGWRLLPRCTGAIFSKSRGGAVGLVAMLAVALYHLRRLRPGLAAAMLVAGLAAVPMLPASFFDRMSSIVERRAGRRPAPGKRGRHFCARASRPSRESVHRHRRGSVPELQPVPVGKRHGGRRTMPCCRWRRSSASARPHRLSLHDRRRGSAPAALHCERSRAQDVPREHPPRAGARNRTRSPRPNVKRSTGSSSSARW